MSEDEKSYISVLLPEARIALFTKDEETKNVYLSLADDWRFARVELTCYEGDIDAATAHYGAEQSPDLVIVQTDTIDGDFIGRLEALGGECAEGTSAIVIGPVNDVNLYRKMIGMGVSDYLVRPVEKESFASDIGETLLQQVGASDSCLIAVIGAKGGVGTTAVSQLLARQLADEMKQKTFLMDAAGGYSTLNVGLDFEPASTLIEAGRAAAEGKEDSLSRMLYSVSDKLTVLSSGGDVMMDEPVSAEHYEALLDHMMVTYPFLVVDLSASPAALRRAVLHKAQKIIMVTTPALTSVRAARTLVQEIKDLRGGSADAISLLLNMKGLSSKHEVSKAQIEEGVDQKLLAEIAFDPDLFMNAESEGVSLSSLKTGSTVASDVAMVLQALLKIDSNAGKAVSESGKGVLGQVLNKLKIKS